MKREILSLHVGQAGNQMGFALWELLLAEHGIGREGYLVDTHGNSDDQFLGYFKPCKDGKFIPRALYIDMESTVIDQLRTGNYRLLYHPNQLISSFDDSSGNFARAYYTLGRALYHRIYDEFRKQVESCDYMQTIMLYRSLGGGCGSGLSSLMVEIFEDFSKVARVEMPIYPSPHFDSSVIAPYNSLLGEHFMMDEFDVGLLIDNDALFDIVNEQLEIKTPTMTTINRLVAQVCSAMTASSRFHSQLYNDLAGYLTNLVPYPRIHFPLTSFSPFCSTRVLQNENVNSLDLTSRIFDRENQLVSCDLMSGRMMCCSLIYRGTVNPVDIYMSLAKLKLNRRIQFVDWCPTCFKVGIVEQCPTIIPESQLDSETKLHLLMLSNNSIVGSIWHRIAQRFHRLHSKRSFVHWYVAEGLDEMEFCESLFNLASLAKDYEEVSVDTKFLKTVADQIAVENIGECEKGEAAVDNSPTPIIANSDSTIEKESETDETSSLEEDEEENEIMNQCNKHGWDALPLESLTTFNMEPMVVPVKVSNSNKETLDISDEFNTSLAHTQLDTSTHNSENEPIKTSQLTTPNSFQSSLLENTRDVNVAESSIYSAILARSPNLLKSVNKLTNLLQNSSFDSLFGDNKLCNSDDGDLSPASSVEIDLNSTGDISTESNESLEENEMTEIDLINKNSDFINAITSFCNTKIIEDPEFIDLSLSNKSEISNILEPFSKAGSNEKTDTTTPTFLGDPITIYWSEEQLEELKNINFQYLIQRI